MPWVGALRTLKDGRGGMVEMEAVGMGSDGAGRYVGGARQSRVRGGCSVMGAPGVVWRAGPGDIVWVGALGARSGVLQWGRSVRLLRPVVLGAGAILQDSTWCRPSQIS